MGKFQDVVSKPMYSNIVQTVVALLIVAAIIGGFDMRQQLGLLLDRMNRREIQVNKRLDRLEDTLLFFNGKQNQRPHGSQREDLYPR